MMERFLKNEMCEHPLELQRKRRELGIGGFRIINI